MAQTTEAACLLQSGTMYSRRLGLRTASGEDVFAGIKPGAVSIYFGDAPIYHFDLEGRWQRSFVDGVHYLKGLDGTVRSIDREREAGRMVLRRKTLAYAPASVLDASIRSVALGLIDDLDSGRLEILGPPPGAKPFTPEGFRGFLERVTHWDPAAWSSHLENYLTTYGQVPFLPPDCPNALVLQGTLGRENGRAFGGGTPSEHHVRSIEEFEEHARAVSRLIGRRVAQYRGVFLGGADVLTRPIREILGFLETIERVFPIVPTPGPVDEWDAVATNLGSVHAFLDDFGTGLPDHEGWRALKEARLGRVTLGVESGDPALRASFGKSWQDDNLRRVVTDLKAVGIGVGVVALVGVGGRGMAEAHLDSTAMLLASLPLDPTDLVSMVDARNFDQSPPDPLSDEETEAQVAALKRKSAAGRASKGPKLVAYNPDKQGS